MTTEAPAAGENQGTPNDSANQTPPAGAPSTPPAAQTSPEGAPAAEAKSGEPAKKPPKSSWGEKWREEAAGDDEALLKRLQRYQSPKDLAKALSEAQKKISDGSYKKPPGEKATAEEVAEWRKANGIPDDPKGYFENLPDGLVIGEDDMPIFEDLGKFLHARNAPPELVHSLVSWYDKFQDDMEGKMHETNVQAKQITEDSLREEWGADYRSNVNLINNLIGSMPKELQDELFRSTTPDGKQVMNNPAMMRWLAQQARELNYTSTVLPGAGSNPKSIDSELAEIQKHMAKHGEAPYYKGPEADKMQARYRELIEMKERLSQRAA